MIVDEDVLRVAEIFLVPVEPASTVNVALPESEVNVALLDPEPGLPVADKLMYVFASLLSANVIDLPTKSLVPELPITIDPTLVVPSKITSVVLACAGTAPPDQFAPVFHTALELPVQV